MKNPLWGKEESPDGVTFELARDPSLPRYVSAIVHRSVVDAFDCLITMEDGGFWIRLPEAVRPFDAGLRLRFEAVSRIVCIKSRRILWQRE